MKERFTKSARQKNKRKTASAGVLNSKNEEELLYQAFVQKKNEQYFFYQASSKGKMKKDCSVMPPTRRQWIIVSSPGLFSTKMEEISVQGLLEMGNEETNLYQASFEGKIKNKSSIRLS